MLPEPYELYDRYAERQERWLDKLPKCCHCGEPIQDTYLFDIEGELYHEDCFKDNFRKDTENYYE